jgi:hypothetical protein
MQEQGMKVSADFLQGRRAPGTICTTHLLEIRANSTLTLELVWLNPENKISYVKVKSRTRHA